MNVVAIAIDAKNEINNDDNEDEDHEDSEWETLSESDMTLVDDTTDEGSCRTDQGSCSRDEVESDHQPEKERSENNLQQIWSSFKGMQLRKSSNNRSPRKEVNEKEQGNKPLVDKDLLKKQIYNLIQERRQLNHREENGKAVSKGSSWNKCNMMGG